MPTREQLANRRKAVEFLRTTDVKQNVFSLYNVRTGTYCAFGAIGRAVGHDPAGRLTINNSVYTDICTALGISERESWRIMDWNDTFCLSFADIAEVLAKAWNIGPAPEGERP